MRRALLLLVCVTAPGCGTTRPAGPVASRSAKPSAAVAARDDAERDYEAVPASALVFRPPLAPADLDPELARAGRDVSAFGGYDEFITEYYYVRTDDRQASGFGPFGFNGDRYERRAVSEKVGVRHR